MMTTIPGPGKASMMIPATNRPNPTTVMPIRLPLRATQATIPRISAIDGNDTVAARAYACP